MTHYEMLSFENVIVGHAFSILYLTIPLVDGKILFANCNLLDNKLKCNIASDILVIVRLNFLETELIINMQGCF